MSALEETFEDEEQPKKRGRGNPAWQPGKSANPAGRPKSIGVEKERKVTARELKERELLMLLRKIRPHMADSVMTAAKIMKNEQAADTNKLRAATILLDAYRKLTLDLYDGVDPEDESSPEVQQQNTPVFSLRMINTEEDT